MYHIISDTHIEKVYPKVPRIDDIISTNCKNLILAGDVGRVENWEQYICFISRCCDRFDSVILVPGNHEYYISPGTKLTINDINKRLKALQKLFINLIVLIDEEYINPKEKKIFFGSTFWSHIPDKKYFKSNLPIFIYPNKRIEYNQWNALHILAKSKLDSAIMKAQELKYELIVISHFAPTFNYTLHSKYSINGPKSNLKNYMYCSDCDEYLDIKKVKTWVFGHTGFNCNILTPEYTRLVSNQYYGTGGIIYNKTCDSEL